MASTSSFALSANAPVFVPSTPPIKQVSENPVEPVHDSGKKNACSRETTTTAQHTTTRRRNDRKNKKKTKKKKKNQQQHAQAKIEKSSGKGDSAEAAADGTPVNHPNGRSKDQNNKHRRDRRRRRGGGNNTIDKEKSDRESKDASIDREDNDDEVDFESYFPPLTVEKTTTDSSFVVAAAARSSLTTDAAAPTTAPEGWSGIAWNAHCAQIKEEEKMKKLQLLENSDAVILTPLAQKRTRGKEVDKNKDEDNHVARYNTEHKDKEQTRQLLTSNTLHNAGRFDMTKLRNRWWQILKEKRLRDAEQKRKEKILAALLETDESSTTSSEDESDSESSSSSGSSSSTDISSKSSSGHDDDEEEEDGMPGPTTTASYLDCPYPLHEAILKDDANAIQHILSTLQSDGSFESAKRIFIHVSRQELLQLEDHDADRLPPLLSADTLSPLQLAVYLDKPHLVKTLLDVASSFPKIMNPLRFSQDDNNNCTTPLMLASELGLDGCIKVLLGHNSDVSVKLKNSGNTALHYACQAGAPASTLRLLLGRTTTKKSKNLQRLLSIKNANGQTPLHVACQYGHVHLVEVFLTIGGSATLKTLKLQDASGQTPLLTAIGEEHADVVMALLMYKGNHYHFVDHNYGGDGQRGNNHAKKIASAAPTTLCPLTWAATKGSMDMVRLLLEFSDPTNAGGGMYDLVEALCAAVVGGKEEMVQTLVEAGANPCVVNQNGITPMSMAACHEGHDRVLQIMLDSFFNVREASQQSRRQDPKLRRQPESYFAGMEQKENKQVHVALTDALIKSLYHGWKDDDFGRMSCLYSSVVLLKCGAVLHSAAYLRLKQSMESKRLEPLNEVVLSTTAQQHGLYLFKASYMHCGKPGSSNVKMGGYNRSGLKFWSNKLCHMPWMSHEGNVQCDWIKAQQAAKKSTQPDESADVVLIAGDESFLVHGELLSFKSAKLAAAIRFARMNQVPESDDPLTVLVDISPKMCHWLLQHIYHGSITSGWATDDVTTCCRDLLELALVAQEYLCPSLLHECEMRLLAARPFQCFCWSCCTSVKESPTTTEKIPLIECVYHVQGPSRLLKADMVLDALAVSQQLEGTPNGSSDCMVKYAFVGNLPSSQDPCDSAFLRSLSWTNWTPIPPFAAVKEASIQALLRNFIAVLKSESFAFNMKAMLEEQKDLEQSSALRQREAEAVLLRLCLDSLADSPLLVNRNERSRNGSNGAQPKSK